MASEDDDADYNDNDEDENDDDDNGDDKNDNEYEIMKMMMMIMPTIMILWCLKCGNKYLYMALYDRHINLNDVGLLNLAWVRGGKGKFIINLEK